MNLSSILKNLIKQMEDGDDDWQMPWHGRKRNPLNVASLQPYQSINRLILWAKAKDESFNSRYWGTFAQWRKRRQPVAFGEKGTMVLRPILKRKQPQSEMALHGFVAYAVFNGDQVLNRNENHPDLFGSNVTEVAEVEQFVATTGADIRPGADLAAYYLGGDYIVMPLPEDFFATRFSTPTQNYYSTLLHELVHWSGHPSRKNRSGRFESDEQNYAFEELVAELGAAFLCSDFQIEDVPRKDHAQYLNSWLRAIRHHPDVLLRAAALAHQASSFLHGLPDADAPPGPGTTVRVETTSPVAR